MKTHIIEINEFPTHVFLGKKSPKKYRINGQKLYNAEWHYRIRREIVLSLKNTFTFMILSKYKLMARRVKSPVIISYEFHIPKDYMKWDCSKDKGYYYNKRGGDRFDIGNLSWIYCKIIDDVLVQLNIIPGDELDYVIGTNGSLFIEEPDIKKRKIVIKIQETNGKFETTK
jgi:hypothetical protein